MTAVIEEKEPGVYVRSHVVDKPVKTEKEIDFFWEAPARRVYDSQKNRIGIFAGGFVSGVFLTLIVTLAVMLLGKSMTSSPGTEVAAPLNVTSVEDLVNKQVPASQAKAETAEKTSDAVTEAAEAAKAAKTSAPVVTTEVRPTEPVVAATTTQKPTVTTAATTAAKPKTAVLGSKEVVIKQGDTIGAIANKYYGSVDPALIDKIVRANKLTNVNAIQIGQKIVLPPKNYQ